MRLLAMPMFCKRVLLTTKKMPLPYLSFVLQLQNQDYILAPYADYWLMLLNLEDADNQAVSRFFEYL